MLGIRPDHLLTHAILMIGVAGLGLFVRLNFDGTRRLRWISWLTYGLCLGGFLSAGLVMLMLGWPPAKEYLAVATAGGGFGFCCGLWGGRFVWKHYRKEIESESEGDGTRQSS